MAKTPRSFGRSECNRVTVNVNTFKGSHSAIFNFSSLQNGGQLIKAGRKFYPVTLKRQSQLQQTTFINISLFFRENKT